MLSFVYQINMSVFLINQYYTGLCVSHYSSSSLKEEQNQLHKNIKEIKTFLVAEETTFWGQRHEPER